MRKILIADSMRSMCDVLERMLKPEFSVACCQDGQTAVEFLGSFTPDLLVIDLSVAQVSGLEVIRAARHTGRNIQILATVTLDTPYIISQLRQLQVDQMCRRPCRPDSIACAIRQLATQSPVVPWNPSAEADQILLQLGFRMGYGMYQNTHTAIMMKYRGNMGTLMKELYPTIAADIRGNALQVEKSIRDAIGRAYKAGNPAIWRLYFGDSTQTHCPSNELFITRIANAIHSREQALCPADRELVKNA